MSIPTIVTIEQIMIALQELLEPLTSNGSGFQIVSRAFKTPDQVDIALTPSLYILQGPISTVRVGGLPAKQTIMVWLFIYTNSQVQDTLASTTLNNAITAVMSILVEPTFPLKEQTLNGLVSNCWIDGEIIYDSGDVQPPGLAVIPLKIMVPTIAI